ncbi:MULTISPECIES: putative nitrogen fixation protein NifT [Okeania]|uniref:Putative nitrogen fixation protein NifT n=1 Tax=Okeania hirsuta TaxID=1458930 RepID=A0A3N6Q1Q3_9CYAN|nr:MULTISPECIES: putative nitrogen fixation protein NifT [Okeania]NEN87680.1 putative nitrogen fixation protein NifT [Okeania sp. SIO3H1]NEP08047.1 putative nitrogen fixation protein NifT [Okeania sp. SIO4D6]NEP38459.1 putative nitrogen fixation protein NifT [Okeania sp. SIO2H7]NEP85005.1 putative nitrogen fixation protein NifT [Okeania sp. SIO3B3]NER04137.1 putative nitrogen fixation protein NifT [Okeania sp. SIO3C4]
MKVILRNNAAGNLEVYVAKKDLEEEVVSQKIDGDIKVLTLTNGWELSIPKDQPEKLPLTIDAKRLN